MRSITNVDLRCSRPTQRNNDRRNPTNSFYFFYLSNPMFSVPNKSPCIKCEIHGVIDLSTQSLTYPPWNPFVVIHFLINIFATWTIIQKLNLKSNYFNFVSNFRKLFYRLEEDLVLFSLLANNLWNSKNPHISKPCYSLLKSCLIVSRSMTTQSLNVSFFFHTCFMCHFGCVWLWFIVCSQMCVALNKWPGGRFQKLSI